MSATIELVGLTKTFGPVTAVDDVTLKVEAGELLTLLGPSGCGKTTLLRLLSGFESPSAGSILMGGADVTHIPPHRRDLNQVFQSYALFPHLTVQDNIAFGLRMRGEPKGEISRKVAAAISLVSLEGLESRYAHQLSGGQRQRVALARAIVPEPRVLLLDEPLSALDAKLRREMQVELRRLQKKIGLTTILVTHDQEEALAMSDRIAVMHAGRIEQLGTGLEVYHNPGTAFVAQFLGESNLFNARVIESQGRNVKLQSREGWLFEVSLVTPLELASGTERLVSIRPENLSIGIVPGPSNSIPARVIEGTFLGPTVRVSLETESGGRLVVLSSGPGAANLAQPGAVAFCQFKPTDAVLLDPVRTT